MTYKMTLNKETAKVLADVLDGWMGTVPEGDAHREALAAVHDDLIRKLNASVPTYAVEDMIDWIKLRPDATPPPSVEALAEAVDEVTDYCLAKNDASDVLDYAADIIDRDPVWVPAVLPSIRRVMQHPTAVHSMNLDRARRFAGVLGLVHDVWSVAERKVQGGN